MYETVHRYSGRVVAAPAVSNWWRVACPEMHEEPDSVSNDAYSRQVRLRYLDKTDTKCSTRVAKRSRVTHCTVQCQPSLPCKIMLLCEIGTSDLTVAVTANLRIFRAKTAHPCDSCGVAAARSHVERRIELQYSSLPSRQCCARGRPTAS